MPLSDFASNAANNTIATLAVWIGALKSTTVAAQANASQNLASLTHAAAAGDLLGFNQGGSPSEIRQVLSVTGSGPYVCTLDANLINTYAVAVKVAHAPKEGSTAREPTGGSPAYARKAETWLSSVARDLVSSNVPVIDIPATTDIGATGYWDAATAGNFIASGLLATIQPFPAQGTLQINRTDTILD